VSDATVDILDSQIRTAEPLTEVEEAIATTFLTAQPLEPQILALVAQMQ
jgi:predicted kinase